MVRVSYSEPVTVRVSQGFRLVAQAELNASRHDEMAVAYRYRVRVPPGSYTVRSSWGINASVQVRSGQTARVNVDAEGCK